MPQLFVCRGKREKKISAQGQGFQNISQPKIKVLVIYIIKFGLLYYLYHSTGCQLLILSRQRGKYIMDIKMSWRPLIGECLLQQSIPCQPPKFIGIAVAAFCCTELIEKKILTRHTRLALGVGSTCFHPGLHDHYYYYFPQLAHPLSLNHENKYCFC